MLNIHNIFSKKLADMLAGKNVTDFVVTAVIEPYDGRVQEYQLHLEFDGCAKTCIAFDPGLLYGAESVAHAVLGNLVDHARRQLEARFFVPTEIQCDFNFEE